MLLRGNSNASARLRRAKSSASAKTRGSTRDIEHINPDVARHHALTAANVAFDGGGRFAKTSNDDSDPILDHGDVTGVDRDNKPLKRRQSIRFTGPTAVPFQHHTITRRNAPTHADIALTTGDPRPVLKRNGSFTQEHTLTALPPVESTSSTPSSYRKLRKSRSMFSPRRIPPLVFANATPRSIERARNHSTRLSSESLRHTPETNRPRNRQSSIQDMSSQGYNPYRKSYDQDAAIQLARDQYLRQLEQQRLKTQPSLLNIRRRGSQKAFRKSVRTSSASSYGPAICSIPAVPSTKQKGLGNKARKLSVTLKNRMKSVFSRNENLGSTLPLQHIEARGVHFGGYLSATSGLEQQGPLPPAPDGDLLFRVRSRSSSLQRMPVYLERTTSPTSIRTSHSNGLSISRSRITSWTNSTAGNTLTKQNLLEKKRLSVIQENGGPHQPSSSSGLIGVAARKSYAMFRKPLRGTTENERVVDSHRIFSALQKRLDEHNRLPAQQNSRSSVSRHTSNESPNGDFLGAQATPTSADGTMLEESEKNLSTPPIRSTRSLDLPAASASEAQSDDVFRPSSAASVTRKPVKKAGGASGEGLTYQQIANRNEGRGRVERKALREVKSAFFPSTLYYQPRNPSPYRRAVQSSIEEEGYGNITGETVDFRRSSGRAGPNAVNAAEDSITSGSIYSRSLSGTPNPLEISLPHAKMKGTGEHGTATIIEPTPSNHRATASSEQRKLSSTSSSGDWRGWMASEVRNLEGIRIRDSVSPNLGKTKQLTHQREYAQIDGEDVLVGGRRRRTSASKQPLAAIHVNAASRPVLRHRSSGQSAERVPLRYPMVDRITSSGRSTTPKPHQKASDPSRTRYSASNISFKQGSLRSKASAPLLGPGRSFEGPSEGLKENFNVSNRADQLPGPSKQYFANYGSRYSPERAERLRRMQRSNAMKSKENMRAFIDGVHKRGHQQENQAINDLTPTSASGNERVAKYLELPESSATKKQGSGSQDMVDLFLQNYRSASPMEEAVSPVFI
ncbi:hypothetical protein MMC13_002703 [Lambiella insularis]|nr:hypothetical protein [Lambiella insularis]